MAVLGHGGSGVWQYWGMGVVGCGSIGAWG